MRIDSIEIKNFKSFVNEVIHFKSQFTVVIGANAMGKTSILDAVAVAVSSYLSGIDIAQHEAREIRKSEVRTSTIDKQPKPQLPVTISAKGFINNEYIDDVWTKKVVGITDKGLSHANRIGVIKKIAAQMLKQSRINGKVVFPVIAYHGTGRLWAEYEDQGSDFKKQEEGVAMAYANCLSPKSSSKEFLSWYKTYEYEALKFEQEADLLFLETFNDCIVSMIPDNRWEGMSYSFKDEDLVGFFTTPEGGKEKLLFSQLSDGYRNVIGMIADIAYRCIKLNPHLGKNAIKETPGIVLIDEIDLHLHPNWQRRIVDDLKNAFPRIQFIATTHSPFIVQSLKSEELIILDEDIIKDGDPFRKNIEDVAAQEMGVEGMPRSEEFNEMQQVAEEYFSLIKQGKTSNTDVETNNLRERLNELEEQFSEDPAFVAALKIERQAKGL